MTALATEIPSYTAGTWTIDPTHSNVGFSVRHMMVSRVRGRFTDVSGTITTADDVTSSSVVAEIAMASIDTGNADRDGHLRTNDFFDIENFPTMTFTSTGLTATAEVFELTGDLTLRGVTKSITLEGEISGFGPDAYGGTRVGFEAKGSFHRSDFGVNWNTPLETGGVVVGEKVDIHLDIQAVLNQA